MRKTRTIDGNLAIEPLIKTIESTPQPRHRRTRCLGVDFEAGFAHRSMRGQRTGTDERINELMIERSIRTTPPVGGRLQDRSPSGTLIDQSFPEDSIHHGQTR
jgi:hypothetical protein